MIIREGHDELLLIAQADHAALAERIMIAWRRDGLAASPHNADILYATRRHDDGWIEHDAAPIVDPAAGRLLDFVHAPDPVRRAIWPASVAGVSDRPYAAALVAQHPIHLYDRYRADPVWQPFFTEMEALRDRHLAAARTRADDAFMASYFFIRMGDLLSLQFCDDWQEPQQHGAFSSRWDGTRLTVTPDPFGGQTVALAVTARRLPRRAFDAPEAAAAFAAAPTTILRGVASGP